MERIVVDVLTGEVSVVPFTDQEIADILAQAEANPPPPAPPAPTLADLQAQLIALQEQIAALAAAQTN